MANQRKAEQMDYSSAGTYQTVNIFNNSRHEDDKEWPFSSAPALCSHGARSTAHRHTIDISCIRTFMP